MEDYAFFVLKYSPCVIIETNFSKYKNLFKEPDIYRPFHIVLI